MAKKTNNKKAVNKNTMNDSKSDKKKHGRQKKSAKRDCEIIINLEKSLYSENAINKAKEDFKDACKITINSSEKSSSYVIFICPKADIEPDVLKGEFCNYVLGLMKDSGI